MVSVRLGVEKGGRNLEGCPFYATIKNINNCKILIEVVADESAKARVATRKEQEREIAAAEAAGVRFLTLSGKEKAQLAELAAPVYAAWGRKIGSDYLLRVQTTLGE